KVIMKYISPLFLLIIFILFVLYNVLGFGSAQVSSYVTDLVGGDGKPANLVAILSVSFILLVLIFLALMTAAAGRKWSKELSGEEGAQ
ncbi:MAG: sodium:calcium symporter, partial [Verrucomicrobiae bacterium]|nr:sodium:calcium symporter [Verrucomicrobiae bacterium]